MDNNSTSGIQIAGFVIVILAVVTWMLKEPELENHRPEVSEALSHESGTLLDVPARLWQDPFRVVEQFRLAGKRAGDEYPGKVEDRRHGDAYLGDLVAQYSGSQIQFIIVSINSSPYPEFAEQRLRARSGVIAGLAKESMEPIQSEHIGYWVAGNEKSWSGGIRIPLEIFQRPSSRGNPKTAFVLWLPEHHLAANSIQRLTVIVNRIREVAESNGVSDHQASVIGPYESGTLGGILEAASQDSVPGLDDPILMLSATATAPLSYFPEGKSESDAYRKLSNHGYEFARTISTDDDLIEAMVTELGLRLADPACLTKLFPPTMNCEEPASGSLNSGDAGYRKHAVIFGEFSTAFGRSLGHLFRETVQSKSPWKDKAPASVHHFGYFRGLDGQSPKLRAQENETGSEEFVFTELDYLGGHAEPALGTAQFDYLRRVSEQVSELDEQLKKAGQGRILSFGILGNDFYDKLLILQALRDRYPNHTFFTTDLDARYLDPRYLEWTRNLVIASGYGLELAPEFQRSLATTRSGYQTSFILATRIISQLADKSVDEECEHVDKSVDEESGHVKDCLDLLRSGKMFSPRLFEVGIGEFVDLTRDRAPTASICKCLHVPQCKSEDSRLVAVHPYKEPATWQDSLAMGGVGFWLASFSVWLPVMLFALIHTTVRQLVWGSAGRVVAGVTGRFQSRARDADPVAVDKSRLRLWAQGIVFALIVLLLVVLFLLASTSLLYWMNGQEEPFRLASGVSIWPAEVIRLVAGALSILFVIVAIRRLKGCDARLSSDFSLSPASGEGSRPVPGFLKGSLGDYWKWYDSARKRSRAVDGYVTCRMAQVLDPGLAADVECRSAVSIWKDYRKHSEWQRRFVRAGLFVALFWIISVVMLFYVAPPMSPHRGESAYYFGLINGMVFVAIPFLMLLFLVLDEARLCRGLIRNFTGARIQWPEDVLVHQAGVRQHGDSPRTLNFRGDNGYLFDRMLTIEFIAKRTEVSGNIIWYPFVILALIIVSLSGRFDNYDTPASVLGLILVASLIALYSAFTLKGTSRRTRDLILADLRDQIRSEKERQSKDPSTRIDLFVKRIEEIHEGAFRHWSEEPVIKALAGVFSIAALIVAEYFSIPF